MSDLPFHIKIMASLGIIKVTQKNLESKSDPKVYPKRQFPHFPRIPLSTIFPLIFIIIIIFTALPLLSDNSNDPSQTLQDKAKGIAEREEKNEWEKINWDNPEILPKLFKQKADIDNSSCEQLGPMLENERWTLRAYIAHTILEKNCV
ncbi:MAG TPA: hypothetical protein HA319_06120 [Nitrosopumilaceae archaeon]|nr:hypothetical protein [Nitrosopumilaceae archaeon]